MKNTCVSLVLPNATRTLCSLPSSPLLIDISDQISGGYEVIAPLAAMSRAIDPYAAAKLQDLQKDLHSLARSIISVCFQDQVVIPHPLVQH
jgi:hypothetical protein